MIISWRRIRGCKRDDKDVQIAAAVLPPPLRLLQKGGRGAVAVQQDRFGSFLLLFLRICRLHLLSEVSNAVMTSVLSQQPTVNFSRFCSLCWQGPCSAVVQSCSSLSVYLTFALARLRAEHYTVCIQTTHKPLWTCIASANIPCDYNVIFKLSLLSDSPSYNSNNYHLSFRCQELLVSFYREIITNKSPKTRLVIEVTETSSSSCTLSQRSVDCDILQYVLCFVSTMSQCTQPSLVEFIFFF